MQANATRSKMMKNIDKRRQQHNDSVDASKQAEKDFVEEALERMREDKEEELDMAEDADGEELTEDRKRLLLEKHLCAARYDLEAEYRYGEERHGWKAKMMYPLKRRHMQEKEARMAQIEEEIKEKMRQEEAAK